MYNFFTNSQYRFIVLKMVWLKFISLPGISAITSFFNLLVSHHGLNMNLYELNIVFLYTIKYIKEHCFVSKLTILKTMITEQKNESAFLKIKSEILSDKILQTDELNGFRNWLEVLNLDESDISKIDEIIEYFSIPH